MSSIHSDRGIAESPLSKVSDNQEFWSLFAPGLAANIFAFGLAAVSYFLLAQAAPSEVRAPAVAEAD